MTAILLSPAIGSDELKASVRTIASVVLASGVAGAVIRSSTFTEMFISRIVDVFYDDKHLKSRNDLAQICTRTLNALLASESPTLQGAVGAELLSEYLDFKHGYVYKDWNVIIRVRSFDAATGLLEVEETVQATVIPSPGRKSFDFLWSWRSPHTPAAGAELTYLEIADERIPKEKFEAKLDGDGVLRSSYTHNFDAEVKDFLLTRRVEKKIELKRDAVTSYRFIVPCLGMSISLGEFPQDKLVLVVDRAGLPRAFKPDRDPKDNSGHWFRQTYSGLIFPRQGANLQWFIKPEALQ
ncbi:hypothetical protein [Pseudoxanthomonas sp. PXM01]|uniref:hypothetical protein n=1 Tax=Pseudoxanthomonas sp. PXM01 TaxID=2769295 RepID=UPI00177C10D9|nr:hypothetical protein [Pseudoxanthomonas sp. PXM01]MBD9471236.1 hypothetical protein [Pseudoxanthomonas sp. PXM01]